MADTVEFAVEVKGTDTAVSDLNRVTAAERQAIQQTQSSVPVAAQAAAAQRQTSQAMQATSASAQQLGQRAGQVGSALGQMGQIVGRLSPELGSIGQVIGQVGGATTALSGAMGPLGLALAAVTTAVTVGSAAWNAYEEHLESTRRRQQELADSFGTTRRGLAEQAVFGAQADVSRLQTEGSTEEFRAAEARLRASQAALNRVRAEEDERYRQQAAQAAREANDERIRAENQRQQDEIQFSERELAIQEREQQRREASAAASRTRTEAAEREHRARLRAFDQAEAQARAEAMAEVNRVVREQAAQLLTIEEQLAANARALRERDAEAQRQALDVQKQQAEQRIQIMRGVYDAETQGLQALLSAADSATRAIVGMHGQTLSSAEVWGSGMSAIGNDVANSLGSNLTSAFQSSLGAWLDGSKSFGEAALDMVRGVTRALTQEGIVQAIVETARGLAALATTWGTPNPAALLHFASAGVWAAVAGGAGLVGAATGAFGGGGRAASAGAGAGGGRPSMAQPQQTPGNVTVNIMTPNAVLTEAERGQMIAQSFRAARRELGAGAVRT